MSIDELINEYKIRKIYKITGPIEHWITTYNTLYWRFPDSHLDKLNLFKRGDIFLLQASQSERRRDYKDQGVIGIGIFSRKEYKKDIGGFLGKTRWHNLMIFSTIFWFGKVNLIGGDLKINRKSSQEILQDMQALSWNEITFEDMRNSHLAISSHSVVSRINDSKKNKLLSLIIPRLSSLRPGDVKEKKPTIKIDSLPLVIDIDPNAPLDTKILTQARKEQSKYRSFLFGNNLTGTCEICGRELPIELLVTAHIKPRKYCINTEKRDYRNIVKPMCLLGCDSLYERGYIVVQGGVVKRNPNKKINSAIVEYIRQIENQKCRTWNNEVSKYYSWHQQFHLS